MFCNDLFQGKPLFPGKSDLDQIFLICKNLGDLLPSQMELFSGNKFFAGLTIPNPGPIEPLEEKVPIKIVGKDGMEVLKVFYFIFYFNKRSLELVIG